VTTTTPDDTDPTRPLAFGYIRAHILMTEHELGDAKADLTDFAIREGYCLAAVFVERVDRAPAAFTALVAEVKRSEAAAVIVPGLHHLAPLGAAQAARDHLEHYTGARVLAARHSP
jgi:hypothetical protein